MFRSIVLIVIVMLCSNLSCFGQNNHQTSLKDSLYQDWINEENSVERRRNSFNDYIWNIYLFNQPDSAEYLARQLYDFSVKHNDLIGQGKSNILLAVSFGMRNNYPKAIEMFQKNVNVYQKVNQILLLGNTYNNIGNCYYEQALFYQGLNFFNKGLLIYNGILDTCGTQMEQQVRSKMQQSYSNIMGVYIGLNELDKARAVSQKSLENLEQMDTKIDASPIHQQRASLEIQEGNYKEALEFINKGIEQASFYNKKRTLAFAYRMKGTVYMSFNQLDSSKKFLNDAGQIFKEINNAKGETDIEILKGKVAMKSKAYKKAFEHFQTAERFAKENNLEFEKIDLYKSYAQYYHATGNGAKAYELIQSYYTLSDSMKQQQNDKLLTALEDKYTYETELSNQALKIEIEQANAKQTKMILLFVGFLALVLAFLSYRFFRLNEELKYQKYELEQREQALSESLKKLEESNYNLEQFAGAAAHDLKAPLRTISSFSKIINRKYRNLIEPKDVEFFDFILSGCKTLDELITGLLQYSSLSHKEIKTEAIDLNTVFHQIRQSLDTNIEDAKATITLSDNLPTCEGQYSLLFQVFSNLVNNAIKFRKAEELLQISVKSVTSKDGYHIISIQDNGIGIATENQKEVFKVFKKLHAASQYEGVGLGLSLSKKIIERLGGEIWLESKLGIGTTLFVKLKKVESLVHVS